MGIVPDQVKGWLKNYLAFCLQNVQSLWDFCGQIMPSYFCTIPKFWLLQVRTLFVLKIFIKKAEQECWEFSLDSRLEFRFIFESYS